ncbi:uncharacterized protein KY384_003813 [Bacidia gigantensis]|uniref:uncharacterized protein n=1 Tax=Bacidia gigantensis TaxID=2732470 RepID=UPI001D03F6A6|nr:uncharacterized protein KY384_003813 [Bacidia gigantensis]KAG8532173.1 hypothetical protein KY384_003813 [Bacidia gigantensis]
METFSDLSRWRETQLVQKNLNFGPAIAYYDLARTIEPRVGMSYNQLAVIDQVTCDNFSAIYNICWALAVTRPHDGARQNLDTQLKQMLKREKPEDRNEGRPETDKDAAMRQFTELYLHFLATCYSHPQSVIKDGTQQQILESFSAHIDKRSSESTVCKIVLLNIAFEHIIVRYPKGSKITSESLDIMLCLNARMFSVLLRGFQTELLSQSKHPKDPDRDNPKDRDVTLTAKSRRLIPWMRQYSAWLACQTDIIEAKTASSSLKSHISILISAYVDTLNLILDHFPVKILPSLEYLLDEDESAMYLEPFAGTICQRLQQRYLLDGGVVKSKSYEQGVKRQSLYQEMLSRIGDILGDALYLRSNRSARFQYEGRRFVLKEDRAPEIRPQSIDTANDITHVSETELLERSEFTERPSTKERETKYPAPKIVSKRETHATQEETNYGPFPASEIRAKTEKLSQDEKKAKSKATLKALSQVSVHSVASTTTEMPDPTAPVPIDDEVGQMKPPRLLSRIAALQGNSDGAIITSSSIFSSL